MKMNPGRAHVNLVAICPIEASKFLRHAKSQRNAMQAGNASINIHLGSKNNDISFLFVLPCHC